MENSLIFQNSPKVILSTNTFIDVPIVLRYDDINLIEVVKEEKVGFTTEIPIFHNDGTYLAKVRGNRIYATEAGEKAGVQVDAYPSIWVCKQDGRTVFEIRQQADAFKTTAELFTPDGYFVKCNNDQLPVLLNSEEKELNLGGIILSDNTISGYQVGIWLKSNGGLIIGANI